MEHYKTHAFEIQDHILYVCMIQNWTKFINAGTLLHDSSH